MLSRMAVVLSIGIVLVCCGKIRVASGESLPVTIRNPETLADGRTIVSAHEVWRTGAGEGEPVFGVIVRVLSDNQGRIYALDNQLSTVFVFSPSGDFLGTIVREGEGPGEVRRPDDMAFLPDSTIGISVPHSGRIIRVSRDGTPLSPIEVGGPEISDGEKDWLEGIGCRAGSMVLLCQRMSHNSGQQHTLHYLAGFDLDGRETGRYFEKTVVDDFAKLRLNDVRNYYPRGRLWTIGPDGRVYLVPERNDYRVHVHAADGTLEKIIERDFRPVKRDPREMEATRTAYGEWYSGFDVSIEMDENEPAITAIMIDVEGYLWTCPESLRYDVRRVRCSMTSSSIVMGNTTASSSANTLSTFATAVNGRFNLPMLWQPWQKVALLFLHQIRIPACMMWTIWLSMRARKTSRSRLAMHWSPY